MIHINSYLQFSLDFPIDFPTCELMQSFMFRCLCLVALLCKQKQCWYEQLHYDYLSFVGALLEDVILTCVRTLTASRVEVKCSPPVLTPGLVWVHVGHTVTVRGLEVEPATFVNVNTALKSHHLLLSFFG